MTHGFVKFLRTIGVVLMVAGTVFVLHGIYTKDVFDGVDLAALMAVLAGAGTFGLKGREKGLYIRSFEKYW